MSLASLTATTKRWDEKSAFETVVICNAGTQFAVFDSGYSDRMPIVMSAEVTLALLGQEHTAQGLKTSAAELLFARVKEAAGITHIRRVTLKSQPFQPAPGEGTHGQLLLVFETESASVDESSVQSALNNHAQDIHNNYAARALGELTMSVARVIATCA